MKWLSALLILPIRLYQRVLSPLKPPTCRFYPSCSHYASEALQTHGALKGLVLGTWRILRCQPFSREGPDPVPPAEDWGRPFRRGNRKPFFPDTREENPREGPDPDDPNGETEQPPP